MVTDGYTANEPDLATNKFINYLSSASLAASIGLDESTTQLKRLPHELKIMLGADYTPVQGKYKNAQNSCSKINLWKTTDAVQYYRYYDNQGSFLAGEIIWALASTLLDIIIDDTFSRNLQKDGVTTTCGVEVSEPKGAYVQLSTRELIEGHAAVLIDRGMEPRMATQKAIAFYR